LTFTETQKEQAKPKILRTLLYACICN